MPIAPYLVRWKAPAVGVHQVGIDLLPLRLECSAKHALADLNGGGLQRIKRSLCGERTGLNSGEIDGGDLSQLVWVPLINATDEDPDTAHGGSFGRECLRHDTSGHPTTFARVLRWSRAARSSSPTTPRSAGCRS
jgi:hypothetical protein